MVDKLVIFSGLGAYFLFVIYSILIDKNLSKAQKKFWTLFFIVMAIVMFGAVEAVSRLLGG